ncbi:expressed unknown protein [Seminavis robusta]|uniref:C6H2-type domain-containing protein n=1 Tax=Seminavis robusta TaxID=568900 RepID=A0A9N8H5U8_9STRA|nr:expressed unknown protein [Seminavis robusta]|eukprot:Sro96_g049450.1 n/a (480) ;mRNA; r:7093-8532
MEELKQEFRRDLEDLFTKPTYWKPEAVCWGCNKAEPKDKPFAQQCPRCKEEGLVPALFCSQKCFKKAWPEHKEFHEEEAQGEQRKESLNGLLQVVQSEEWQSLAKTSDYDALIFAASKKLAAADVAGAKRLLRKAQKLDTRRPEAFYDLGTCYSESRMEHQAVSCFEEACKRWAMVGLTGFLGDSKLESRHPEWAIDNWSQTIYMLAKRYLTKEHNDRVKPVWWCHDGMLKRITKIVLPTLTAPHQIREMSLTRAYALSGVVSGGVFCTSAAVPDDRTCEELREASKLFKDASEIGGRDAISGPGASVLLSHSHFMLDVALSRHVAAESTVNPSPQAGLWVIVHGLKNPSCSDMNTLVGRISKDGIHNGQFVVQVDGRSEFKMIHPRNLLELPLQECFVALLSCLNDEDQWKITRVIALEICILSMRQVSPEPVLSVTTKSISSALAFVLHVPLQPFPLSVLVVMFLSASYKFWIASQL